MTNQQGAPEALRRAQYLTVVYRDIKPGDEARELIMHPKMTASSWSHVMNERDRLAALVEAQQPAPSAAAAPEGGPPGSGGWQKHAIEMERQRDYYRQRCHTMEEHQNGGVWYWQGDDGDSLESMGNSMLVVIRADQLRSLMHPSPTPQEDSQPAPVATNYKQALWSKNCMQCCVSYMLGLPLNSAPDFATDGGWELFSEFVDSKGYAAVMLPGNHEFEADYLASGTTARGTSHMVVMNDGKLVHDPHPSNAGLTEVQCVWLLAKKATPQRDDREAFEACAKAYTSNVSFERDGDDYEDMTASLLWHGWKLRAARAPADSVTAPAGGAMDGWKLAPEEPTLHMGWAYLDAARESEPLRTHTFNHAGYRAMLAAAPTPPAQAADSVREDAAREVLMEHSGCGSGTQVEMLTVRLNPGDKVVMLKGRITQAIDAARKQGANHD